jgi:hypothetical protein
MPACERSVHISYRKTLSSLADKLPESHLNKNTHSRYKSRFRVPLEIGVLSLFRENAEFDNRNMSARKIYIHLYLLHNRRQVSIPVPICRQPIKQEPHRQY